MEIWLNVHVGYDLIGEPWRGLGQQGSWGPGHPAGGTDILSSLMASILAGSTSQGEHYFQLTCCRSMENSTSFPFSSPASDLSTASTLDSPPPYPTEQYPRQEALQEEMLRTKMTQGLAVSSEKGSKTLGSWAGYQFLPRGCLWLKLLAIDRTLAITGLQKRH